MYSIGSRFSTCILLEHSFPFHFSLVCFFMYDYLSIRYLFVLEFWRRWCRWVLMLVWMGFDTTISDDKCYICTRTSSNATSRLNVRKSFKFIHAFFLLIKNKNKTCLLKSKCPLIKSTLVLYSNWLITIWPYDQVNLKIS